MKKRIFRHKRYKPSRKNKSYGRVTSKKLLRRIKELSFGGWIKPFVRKKR